MSNPSRNPTLWKAIGVALLFTCVVVLEQFGGSAGFGEAVRGPIFALMGTTGYAVALISTNRADILGRLLDLAAHTAVVVALLLSAINWLVSAADADAATLMVGAVFAIVTLLILTAIAIRLVQEHEAHG